MPQLPTEPGLKLVMPGLKWIKIRENKASVAKQTEDFWRLCTVPEELQLSSSAAPEVKKKEIIAWNYQSKENWDTRGDGEKKVKNWMFF